MTRPRLHLLDHFLQEAPQRRKALLIAMTGLVMVILVAAGIISARVAEGHGASSDKIAVIGDVIAGATLLLAVVAGLVAVLAYAVSTGAPNLRVKVGCEGNQFRQPTIDLAAGEDLGSPRDYELTILLRNISSYSARNPVVIVRMMALSFVDLAPGLAWDTTGRTVFRPQEALEVQWDGGVDYSVHGHSIRKLPPLRLKQLTCRTRDPSQPPKPGRGVFRKQVIPGFEFEILAEGYRRVVTVPVKIRRARKVIFSGDGWRDWM